MWADQLDTFEVIVARVRVGEVCADGSEGSSGLGYHLIIGDGHQLAVNHVVGGVALINGDSGKVRAGLDGLAGDGYDAGGDVQTGDLTIVGKGLVVNDGDAIGVPVVAYRGRDGDSALRLVVGVGTDGHLVIIEDGIGERALIDIS